MKGFFVAMLIIAAAGSLFAEDRFEYNAKSKRDPFVPLISEGGAYVSDAYGISSIKDVRLEGIVWDARDSAAIINGEIVKEGEELGSVKVLRIERNSVVFDVEGEEVRVELTAEP